jgi:two-component system cell cycle sensor histidine kinase/response regulator CckA
VTTNQRSRRHPPLVLLVDDDPLLLPLARELLEYLGFQVLTATAGDQALAIFRQHQTDIALVIMDLYMPRLNGYQVLHELQTMAPTVKVIISSGFLGQEEMAKLEAAGVAGLLHKPFRAQQLQEEITRVLAA